MNYSSQERMGGLICLISILILLQLLSVPNEIVAETLNREDLDNNNHILDISDLDSIFDMEIDGERTLVERTEPWEYPLNGNALNKNTLGYISVVKNIYGESADNKYYLYYAHHDPRSGIGCAVSDSLDSNFIKLKEIDSKRSDSQVIKPELSYDISAHFSSPCVVWNSDIGLWHMYFHYYKNEFDIGRGHQKTGLATCSNLSENKWKILKDSNGNIVPVLPTTSERWMNSQSSYHLVFRGIDNYWMAFLRGTGGEYSIINDRKTKWTQDTTKLGFGRSINGIDWQYFEENPIIESAKFKFSNDGVFRPGFIAVIRNGTYLISWLESKYYDMNTMLAFGITNDFKTVYRLGQLWKGIKYSDGISVLRKGDAIYVITGNRLYIMRNKNLQLSKEKQ